MSRKKESKIDWQFIIMLLLIGFIIGLLFSTFVVKSAIRDGGYEEEGYFYQAPEICKGNISGDRFECEGSERCMLKIDNNKISCEISLNENYIGYLAIDDLMKRENVDDFCKTKDAPWGWYSDCGITCPITNNEGYTKYDCYSFSDFFKYLGISK